MRARVRRHPLLSQVVVSYAFSWVLWIPAVLAWRLGCDPDEAPWWLLLVALVGSYGPSVAAVVVTAVQGGRAAVGTLFSRFRIWRVGLRWYLVVLAAPPLALAVAMTSHVVQGHSLGRFDPGQWPLVLGLPLLALPFGPLGEELGWRGYALPALQSRHTALTSSVILGVVWTFWHLPAFWAPSGTLISGSPVTVGAVAFYLVFTIGLTILMTWIFNNTNGSLPLAVLFHAMTGAGILFPLFPDLTDTAIALITRANVYPVWAMAGLVILLCGGRSLAGNLSPQTATAVSPVITRRGPARRLQRLAPPMSHAAPVEEAPE